MTATEGNFPSVTEKVETEFPAIGFRFVGRKRKKKSLKKKPEKKRPERYCKKVGKKLIDAGEMLDR